MVKKNKLLYIQIALVLLAFITMVAISYSFSSRIVYGHIVNRAEEIIASEQTAVESVINDSRLVLGIFANTVDTMLESGYSFNALETYIKSHCQHLMEHSNHRGDFGFVYGWFETKGGQSGFISGSDWIPDPDYVPQERPWFAAAVAAQGAITDDKPYIDARTGELVYSFSRAIYAENGELHAVVSIDVPLQSVADQVVEAAAMHGGYGMLADADFIILSHPDESLVGLEMSNQKFPAHAMADELKREGRVFEYRMISYLGDDSLAFFQKLPNGWYIGFVTPQAQYYSDVTLMATTLIATGALLALVLILILVQIDKMRVRADYENKLKSEFLANMSHEIRTPMNAIIGMTIIGKGAKDDSRKAYCFEKIENASQHLLGVINDILDMSKIEANKFELSEEEFAFEKMLQRVVSIVGFRAAERKQDLSVFIDKSIPPMLIGDDQRLAQVITNLLGNAVKFTPEGGSIKIDTRFAGIEKDVYTIRVSITDTGIGITPEQQQKLFSPFRQADANTTRKFGGTGLGLAISKGIVEMMGGTIEVESELGKGSSFSFTFKAKRGSESGQSPSAIADAITEAIGAKSNAAQTQQESGADSMDGIFAGKRILLAEDVEVNREILMALLEATEVEIDSAEDGEQAVSLFTQSPEGHYDLVFMDVQMPNMDGHQATREIRHSGHKSAGAVPIVAMTANVFKEDVQQCMEAGMDSHIGKPIDIEELFAILRKYLLES